MTRTYRYEIVWRKPSGEAVVLGKCAGWSAKDRFNSVHKKAHKVLAWPIHCGAIHGLTHCMRDKGDDCAGLLWGFVGLRSIMPHDGEA